LHFRVADALAMQRQPQAPIRVAVPPQLLIATVSRADPLVTATGELEFHLVERHVAYVVGVFLLRVGGKAIMVA
jgi:hypothetical protein